MNQCEQCLHYTLAAGAQFTGECKRFPPVVRHAGDMQLSSVFPLVKGTDCCGEWAAKESDLKHTSTVSGVVQSEIVARAVRKAARKA